MTWYYAENDQQRGPVEDDAWAELVAAGKITPDTLVWHEGLADWTRYVRIAAPPALPSPDPESETVLETPGQFAARILEKDYLVDTGCCIRRSWELLRANLWSLVGATLVTYSIILVGSNLPWIELAMPLAFHGVFMGGLFGFFLKAMRGQNPEFSEIFSGFEREVRGQLMLKTLVSTLVMLVCFLPGLISLVISGALKPNGTFDASGLDPMTMLVTLGLFLLGSLPACYFGFCWIFALPLIVDRRMKFWPAMRLSQEKVLQHPWLISFLLIVAGIVGFIGIFGFCLGVIFTLPLYVGSMMYLYTDIFDDGKSV